MGNRASLDIVLDHGNGVAQAGTAIKGKVVATVRFPMRGERAALQLYGKEKVSIKSSTPGKDQPQDAQRQFFSVHLTLREFAGGFAYFGPGTYTFPFTVRLPESLPSSTKHPLGEGRTTTGFRIQYKLKASLGRLKTEQYLWVASASLPDEKVQYMVRPTSFPIKSLGFSKGSVTLGASVEDTNIGRGTPVEVHLSCRNDSSADIRRVEIKLMEYLDWTVQRDGGPPSCSRDEKITLFQMNDVDLPGLSKQRKGRQELRRQTRSDPDSHRSATYEAIHRDLISGENKVRLMIPNHARDSYRGQLVQIRHSLEIKLQTGSLVNNPVTTLPLRIGNPPPKQTATVVNPPPSAVAVPQPNIPATPPPQVVVIPDSPGTPTPAPHTVPPSTVQVPAQGPSSSTPYQQTDIPMAAAVVIPPDAIEASMTFAEDDVIVLGGDAIITPTRTASQESEDESEYDLSDLRNPPENPAFSAPTAIISLEALLREMSRSVNDFDIVAQRLQHNEWRGLFASISPEDYGSIIAHVHVESDQPRVAILLAPYVNGGDCFTCRYAAAAVARASEWSRSTVAERLVPQCLDISSDHGLIREQLNEWERTVTERFFDAAIESSARANLRQ